MSFDENFLILYALQNHIRPSEIFHIKESENNRKQKSNLKSQLQWLMVYGR